ncbi:MAG: hypothetical protein Q8P93_04435 [bacterium]|nr:hypothetical protein [bacterium]
MFAFFRKYKKVIASGVLGIMVVGMIVALPVQKTSAVAMTEVLPALLNYLIRDKKEEQSAPISCEGGAWNKVKNIFNGAAIESAVGCTILYVGEGALWVSGLVLDVTLWLVDEAIRSSITDFDDLVSKGVKEAWRASRDVANLFFIFLLLYAAAGYMLNLPSIAGKGYIVRLIIIAVFINFSFALTSIIIDVTNVAAQTLYNQMTSKGKISLGDLLADRLSVYNKISNSVPLDILTESRTRGKQDQVLYTEEVRAKIEKSREDQIETVAKGFGPFDATLSVFGGTIVILVAALAFFIGGALLMLRTIVLIFSLALAPLAFLTALFPKFDYMQEWWDGLIKNAIFGPAYMLMMYISLTAIAATGAAETTGYGLIVKYILFVGLLLGGVYLANRLGVSGAAWASGLVDTAKGYGIDAAKWTGGQTAGRLVRKVADVTGKGLQKGGFRGVSRVGRYIENATGASYKAEREERKKGYENISDESLERYATSGNEVQKKVAQKHIAERSAKKTREAKSEAARKTAKVFVNIKSTDSTKSNDAIDEGIKDFDHSDLKNVLNDKAAADKFIDKLVADALAKIRPGGKVSIDELSDYLRDERGNSDAAAWVKSGAAKARLGVHKGVNP